MRKKKNYKNVTFNYDDIPAEEKSFEESIEEEVKKLSSSTELSDTAKSITKKIRETDINVSNLFDSSAVNFTDFDSLPDGQSAIDDDISNSINGKKFLNEDTCKNPVIVQCLRYAKDIPPEPLPKGIIQDINCWSDNELIVSMYHKDGISEAMKEFLANLLFAKNIRSIYNTTLKRQASWTKSCTFDDAFECATWAFQKALTDFDPNYVNEVGAKTKFNTFLTTYIINEINKLHSKIKNRNSREESLDVPMDADSADYNSKSRIELIVDDDETPNEALMRETTSKGVYFLLSKLSCMERFVTVQTFGLTRSRTQRTQAEIGAFSGRTQADISKLLSSAIDKMRDACGNSPELLQQLQDAAMHGRA